MLRSRNASQKPKSLPIKLHILYFSNDNAAAFVARESRQMFVI